MIIIIFFEVGGDVEQNALQRSETKNVVKHTNEILINYCNNTYSNTKLVRFLKIPGSK